MEMFDRLTARGVHTGKVVSREEAHKTGAWHRAVLLFLVNDRNQVLMQRRSPHKSLWPNRWDGTGGGHVDASELGMFAVIRELREELGIEMAPGDVRYIGGCLSEQRTDKMWNRHWNEFFVAHGDVDVARIRLQETEVSEVAWVNFDTLKTWVRERSDKLTEKWEAFEALIRYVEGYCAAP